MTMQALLLTADSALVSNFTRVSNELGIRVQSAKDSEEGASRLTCAAFEAIVLDFDTVPTAIPFLGVVKDRGLNQRAIIFAVTSDSVQRDKALQDGAHFVICRPIGNGDLKQTLSSAYDLMYGERRRYFRCAVELPVCLKADDSGIVIECTTMNLSSDGVALQTPVPLKLAGTVQLALTMPDKFVLYATGIVIWSDKHGKCGLKIRCKGPEMRAHLDAWLDTRFADAQRA